MLIFTLDFVMSSKPIGISNGRYSITDPTAELKYSKIMETIEKIEEIYGITYEDYCWMNNIDVSEEYIEYKKEMENL